MSLFKYNQTYKNTKRIHWGAKVPGIVTHKDSAISSVMKNPGAGEEIPLGVGVTKNQDSCDFDFVVWQGYCLIRQYP